MSRGPLIVSAVGEAEGSLAAAAALACALAGREGAALLLDVGAESGPRPAVVASSRARELEGRFAAELPEVRAAARGVICHVALSGGPPALADALGQAGGLPCVVHVAPAGLHELIATGSLPLGAMLRADLGADLSLTALAVGSLHSRGLRVRVLKRPLGFIATRRALAGALSPPARGGLPTRLLGGLMS